MTKGTRGPKRGAIVLMVLGALTAGAGAVGLATSGDKTAATGSPSPTLSASLSIPPIGSPSAVAPSVAPSVAPETAEQFLPLLANAVRNQQTDFLLARLHPEVISLYGEDQCRTFVSTLNDPTRAYVIMSVSSPGTWNYTPDGRSIPVDDVYTVRVSATVNGKTTTGDVHLGLVEGQLRWFTDCGTPL
jgi:hypothetical protein